jgi:hypothetical protein
VVTAIPPELERRPFLLTEARELGLDRGVLRGGRFRRVFRQVYVRSDVPDTVFLRADAARLLLPPAVFSHHTAAALRRLPVPRSTDVHVVLPRSKPGPEVAGIRVHRMECGPDEVENVDGRCLTVPSRTWVDLSAHLGFTDLVILGDATLHRFSLEPDVLSEAAERAGRRHGAKQARGTVQHLERRAESPAETRTRLILVRHGLPRPEAGLDLYDEDWCWTARPDLLYRDPPVVIQYDGESHFKDGRARRQDVARDELTRELNYEVVVVTARDLHQEMRLVDRVMAARERAAGRRARGYLVDPITRRQV